MRHYACAHVQKRRHLLAKTTKPQQSGGGIAFRRVYPARAYTTVVVLVLSVLLYLRALCVCLFVCLCVFVIISPPPTLTQKPEHTPQIITIVRLTSVLSTNFALRLLAQTFNRTHYFRLTDQFRKMPTKTYFCVCCVCLCLILCALHYVILSTPHLLYYSSLI